MKLNSAGCAGTVGVEVNVSLEPKRNINCQLLVERLLSLNVLPKRLDGLNRPYAAVVVEHNRLYIVLGHNVRASQVRPVGRKLALVGVVAAEKFVDTLARINTVGVLLDRLAAD